MKLGQLLVKDEMRENPLADWGDLSDPYYWAGGGVKPYPELDPYVKTKAFVRPFRRIISRAGVESLYDKAQDYASKPTRTQLYSWSRYSARFRLVGERDVVIPFRRHASGFAYDIDTGGGITKYSQLWQIKSVPTIGKPFLSMTQGRDGIKLVYDSYAIGDGTGLIETLFKSPPGAWHKLVLRANFDRANGWYELWLDGAQVAEREPVPMLGVGDSNGPAFGSLCIGNYHNLAWPDGTGTSFAHEDVITDFRACRIHAGL